MASQETRLWVFLDETLPAEEGKSLLGTLVADIQIPTNGYEPRSAGSRSHPFLLPTDILDPSIEDWTINAGENKGTSFDAGLHNFVSGNWSSTKTRQATLNSTHIITYNLREPDAVFKKIRNTPAYWQQVEELIQRKGSKPLYFVRGYKIASNPVMTLDNTKQRSFGGEITAPILEATGVVLPVTGGDPYLGLSLERGTIASQSGSIKNERLFAIQYWSVVKRREVPQGQKRRFVTWSRSKRVDDISPGIPSGNHVKFSGDKEDIREDGEEDEEEEEEEDDDDDDEEDDEDWVLDKDFVIERIA